MKASDTPQKAGRPKGAAQKVRPKDARPHILIVDDDSILREVAGESLRQAGFSVSEAENGARAMVFIERHRPEIVLLDVMMPEMDGFETCRAIREMPGGDMIPVVMITALEDLDSINKAYEAGATDFITKPINWVILVQRVRYMLRAVQLNNERNRLQQQLQQAQRLKAIGTLASGIAHDFKNLLQIIQGSVELLMLDKEGTDPDMPDLQEIFNTTRVGHELVQQMLAYSRSLKSRKKRTDLNAHVSRIVQGLKKSMPASITIRLRLEENLPPLAVDPVQIEQVLINLATNARDAMPEGGVLSIRTSTVELTEDYCKTHPKARPGGHVCVSVTDSGEGMDEATRGRIFEPFFSTKEVGKGTGLGLSMAYGIVENHGGQITCESRPGKGSRFTIYLPQQTGSVSMHPQYKKAAAAGSVKPQEAVPATAGKKADPAPPASRKIILLVDDEHLIQKFGKRRLEHEGYAVHTVSDGESALELYREKKEEIDLVLLDLMMPGMGGKKCLKGILQINPEAKVVIASAHSSDDGTMQELKPLVRGFLRKPYLSEQLLKAVRGALEAS